MKIFINTIAGIAFIGQLIAFIFNCLTLQNILFLAIVLLGGYVLISQLFVQHDFILTSCLLLLFDIYIVRKVLHILCTASTKSGKA